MNKTSRRFQDENQPHLYMGWRWQVILCCCCICKAVVPCLSCVEFHSGGKGIHRLWKTLV